MGPAGNREKTHAWLQHKRLVGPDVRISAADAARLRELREAIRALTIANQAGQPDPASTGIVRRASRTARLRVAVDDAGRTVLEPDRPSVDGAVAALLGILHEAQLTGQWRRLKGCRQCGYAFFDRSQELLGVWCAMPICGNRTKNRAYRRRRSSTTTISMTTMDATASSRRGVVEAPAQWRASLCRGAENGLPTRQWLPRTDLTQETSWGAVTATANDRRSCRPCHLRATSSGHQRSAADGQGHSERAVRLGWLVWGSRAANWSQRVRGPMAAGQALDLQMTGWAFENKRSAAAPSGAAGAGCAQLHDWALTSDTDSITIPIVS
jgi:predicted RNA-binding Zn ribbon-like protein